MHLIVYSFPHPSQHPHDPFSLGHFCDEPEAPMLTLIVCALAYKELKEPFRYVE